MNNFLTSAQLKALARGQLVGRYKTAIWAMLLVASIGLIVDSIISAFFDTTTVIGTILYFLISYLVSVLLGLFTVGESFLYLKLATGQPIAVSDVWYGFARNRDTSLRILAVYSLLQYVFIIPYSILSTKLVNLSDWQNPHMEYFLPFCIAYVVGMVGIVYIDLLFSQMFYLVLDFPSYTAKEIIRHGIQLIKGSKGRLFYVEVSFLPLLLLCVLSAGIGLLWVIPYMSATQANFFLDLMKHKNMNE